MKHNPEIEHLVDNAVKIAQSMQHEFVVTEHLLLSMVRYEPFRKTLDKFGVEVDSMDQEIEGYLRSITSIVSSKPDLQPRKTESLERVFNRAGAQVVFTGRRSLSTIDLYLSIMTETNSHAHYS